MEFGINLKNDNNSGDDEDGDEDNDELFLWNDWTMWMDWALSMAEFKLAHNLGPGFAE